MTRHGKNNTASAVFTSYERSLAEGGSKRQRLGAHSMAKFDACRLCLSTAKDPRIDSEGHIFCHECILEDLVKQKKDIKRQQALLKIMQAEEAAKRADALAQARNRVLRDFEKTQSGLGAAKSSTSASGGITSVAGTKRKLDLSDPQLVLSADIRAAEERALLILSHETALSQKAKLPNFWLPSLTPSAPATQIDEKEVRLESLCRVGRERHRVGVKELVRVVWGNVGTASEGVGEREKGCAACGKALNNNTRMAVLRPCGHILCLTCVDTLVRAPSADTHKRCPSCDTPLEKKSRSSTKKDRDGKDGGEKQNNRKAEEDDGVIEVEREGTGYAAGGMSEATRFDLSFQ